MAILIKLRGPSLYDSYHMCLIKIIEAKLKSLMINPPFITVEQPLLNSGIKDASLWRTRSLQDHDNTILPLKEDNLSITVKLEVSVI